MSDPLYIIKKVFYRFKLTSVIRQMPSQLSLHPKNKSLLIFYTFIYHMIRTTV